MLLPSILTSTSVEPSKSLSEMTLEDFAFSSTTTKIIGLGIAALIVYYGLQNRTAPAQTVKKDDVAIIEPKKAKKQSSQRLIEQPKTPIQSPMKVQVLFSTPNALSVDTILAIEKAYDKLFEVLKTPEQQARYYIANALRYLEMGNLVKADDCIQKGVKLKPNIEMATNDELVALVARYKDALRVQEAQNVQETLQLPPPPPPAPPQPEQVEKRPEEVVQTAEVVKKNQPKQLKRVDSEALQGVTLRKREKYVDSPFVSSGRRRNHDPNRTMNTIVKDAMNDRREVVDGTNMDTSAFPDDSFNE